MKAAAETAHVQAARASQSASAKPVEPPATETVEAAATEAVKTTGSTVEATASTVEATSSTVEAAAAKAARQSRRCAYYKGQQNSAQLTCSPHNAPHKSPLVFGCRSNTKVANHVPDPRIRSRFD